MYGSHPVMVSQLGESTPIPGDGITPFLSFSPFPRGPEEVSGVEWGSKGGLGRLFELFPKSLSGTGILYPLETQLLECDKKARVCVQKLRTPGAFNAVAFPEVSLKLFF